MPKPIRNDHVEELTQAIKSALSDGIPDKRAFVLLNTALCLWAASFMAAALGVRPDVHLQDLSKLTALRKNVVGLARMLTDLEKALRSQHGR